MSGSRCRCNLCQRREERVEPCDCNGSGIIINQHGCVHTCTRHGLFETVPDAVAAVRSLTILLGQVYRFGVDDTLADALDSINEATKHIRFTE